MRFLTCCVKNDYVIPQVILGFVSRFAWVLRRDSEHIIFSFTGTRPTAGFPYLVEWKKASPQLSQSKEFADRAFNGMSKTARMAASIHCCKNFAEFPSHSDVSIQAM